MKKLLLLIVAVLLASMLLGCGNQNAYQNKENSNVSPKATSEGTQNKSELASNENQKSGDINKNDTSSSNTNKTNTTSEIKVEIAEGNYVGQIDGTSIEIIINGVPTAFRLSEKLLEVIEKLNTNDRVKITYYKNEYGQNILLTCTKQ